MSKYEKIETLISRTTQSSQNREFAERVPDYIDDDILYICNLEKLPDLYNTKMYANLICFCEEGTMDVTLNGDRCSIEVGEVLICPANTVLGRPMVSPDFKFSIVAFTENILHELLRQNMDIWNKAMYIRKGHVLKPCNDDDREMMMEGSTHMMALLKLILKHHELGFRREMICSLLQIILLLYCSVQQEKEKEENDTTGEQRQMASTAIFNNFMALLRKEKKKHQPVSYYADQLFITPKHLTFVCNQVAGRPATDLIQAAVTEDIIMYLRDPSYTVKQIATYLGFENLSFFGKFVKKKLGMSPNDYRKRLLDSRN